MLKYSTVLGLFLLIFVSSPAFAVTDCKPVENKSIKVEGYIAKKFKKQKKKIFREFGEMGHTRVALRVFPMGETSKVVAIGRCVPAYIARHVLQKTQQYSTGVESLVQQQFLGSHWFGVGTTIFDEPSQQKVTAEQLQQLLDPELSTDEFHVLYRKLSVPDAKVPFFGLKVPNVKIAVDE